jgi:DNA polymerase (family 10)
MPTTLSRNDVAKALHEVSVFMQLQGENAFKTRAYDAAAERISSLSEDLSTLVKEERLTELPGIGEGLATKIAELVTTGKLALLEELRSSFPETILELLEVPELGPKKAKALYEQLAVGSLDDLERACRDGKVHGLKGFGEKTEKKLLAGVEFAKRQRAGGVRKTLFDVLPHAQALLAWVRACPAVERASIAGSVRRLKETIGDVDLVASSKTPDVVFKHFTSNPAVAEVIGAGESKASVRLAQLEFQVDLRVVPDEDFAAALHHFTGSKAHHVHLRGLAQEKGLTISEWGLFTVDGSTKLPIGEERDLYAQLGLQYVPPELREDWGEIESAAAKRLPAALIESEDLKGNIHAHTTWSDGNASILEMAQKAQALGYTYLTITDHSRSAAYANGLSIDRLKAQWDEIDEVNSKVAGFRILKGVESDILKGGELDYPDSVLAQLDVVIGSIHQRYGLDEDAMTKRVLEAFDNPHFHIWGHPSGRLLLKREPVPLRMDEILAKAAQRGIAIEVNGCPERMDLAPPFVRRAIDLKIPLVLSTDAHSLEDLRGNTYFAVATARRGWATRADVLNTLDVKNFLSRLRARRTH